ncbi:MAG: DNA polymerase III subunit beta [Parcubacteria group bacterium Athens0416_74]|nr:MAG: DNA polymerase III subunit beta [Parcubacteria group bacterium Athens0416_74]
MKITTTKEKLLNAILMVERITGKKESLPILSCVLIDTTSDITLRATNLEAGIEVTIPGEISEKGVVAVSASILSQTIRSIGGDKISLSSEEGNLLIESRGTKTLIKAVPHEEFPVLSSESGKSNISLSRERLIHGIQSVSYAASPSMIRPDLGSIYISIQDGSMVCVATDSFRLAEKVVSETGSKTSGELLIPLKHALELVHVLEKLDDEKISLSADDSQLVVVGSGTRFVSRVVDATFPNYKEIIPKKFTTEATMLKNDLAEMLRKARVFSGNEMHVGLHVYPKKKIFTATARSADVGEMSDSIDAALSGEDLDINFHIGYLADCLSSIASDSVILSFSGAGRPLVIRGVSDGNFTYLVMPLNR